MARTTSADVQGVLAAGRDYDESPEVGSAPSLTPYIDTASAKVDDIVEYASDEGLDAVPAARLELIERWLAAHYYCVSDQPFQSKSTAGASGSFQGQTGKGLESTKYGQTAIDLDPTGYLRSLASEAATNSSRSASMFWGGTTKPNQTSYADRNA